MKVSKWPLQCADEEVCNTLEGGTEGFLALCGREAVDAVAVPTTDDTKPAEEAPAAPTEEAAPPAEEAPAPSPAPAAPVEEEDKVRASWV